MSSVDTIKVCPRCIIKSPSATTPRSYLPTHSHLYLQYLRRATTLPNEYKYSAPRKALQRPYTFSTCETCRPHHSDSSKFASTYVYSYLTPPNDLSLRVLNIPRAVIINNLLVASCATSIAIEYAIGAIAAIAAVAESQATPALHRRRQRKRQRVVMPRTMYATV